MILMEKRKTIPLNLLKTRMGEAVLEDGVLVVKPDFSLVPPDGSGSRANPCKVIDLVLTGARAEMGGVGWNEKDYVILDLMAEMDSMAKVQLHFHHSPGCGDEPLSAGYSMVPGRRVKMAVSLGELDSHRYFLPTLPGAYKGHVSGKPTRISDIGAVRITLARGREIRALRIYGMWLSDTLPDMTVAGSPVVDPFGQRRGVEWEGKITGEEALKTYLRGEYEKAGTGGGYPEGWSRYGGWLKKKFDATGFFHTHHDGRRWWLVDPDGYAFFSNGCCYGSRCGVHGFVDRMENLFEWLPEGDPAYRDAWTTADRIAEFVKRNGAESGKSRKMFNFARANMIRVFGDGWWEAWARINGARLKSWGFNTIGVGVDNYFDEHVHEYLAAVKIPFVWTLKNFPLTDDCVFRDFPDVFSPEYERRSETFAKEQLAPFAGNRYMIGYFVTNEPEWLFQRSVNLAERVLAHPEKLYTKTALIDFLRERYHGSIADFNSAWNLSLDSFDGLYAPVENADTFTAQSAADLAEFRLRMLDRYCRVPDDALRGVDGDHLNLGMRYSSVKSGDLAGDLYSDVVSFNCYSRSPAESLRIGKESVEKPLIIGEWHIAGTDRRLFASGLLAARSQPERAKACTFYMQTGMADPACVGMHYFEFNDQPLLGRFDGECMQHGLIDVCNRPYAELTQAMRATARILYELCDGARQPAAEQGELVYPF